MPYTEIEKNDYNLNLPRYIDSQKEEDRQDIEGHLHGGIPEADIDALRSYWEVCPSLERALFEDCRRGYAALAVDKAAIKSTIFERPEFVAFMENMNAHFEVWRARSAQTLKSLDAGCNPKEVIFDLSEDLLAHYTEKPLINKYDVYQHMMDYWSDGMQDDCYSIAADGWQARTERVVDKKGKDKGWACDLIPKELIVARYFADEQAEIDQLDADLEAVQAQLEDLEEEHSGDEGAFAELDKVNKANVTASG